MMFLVDTDGLLLFDVVVAGCYLDRLCRMSCDRLLSLLAPI